MPLLDVSEVITDPDFSDSAILKRNTQTIDTYGIATNTPTTTNIYGVVTSDKGDVLIRKQGGAYITGTILFHTLTKLTSGGAGLDADVITWDGRDYTVTDVNNYSRYGRGFVCARCEIVPLNG